MATTETVTVGPLNLDLPRFAGGMKWIGVFGVIGVIGTGITLAGAFGGNQDAWFSYQAAFAFWTATAVGGLILLAAHHAANAKWPTAIRRPMEAVAGAMPVMLVLGIPLLLPNALSAIYPWYHPEKFDAELLHHFHGHKELYLAPGVYYVRQAIYWVVFLLATEVILSWSKKLDEVGGHEFIRKTRSFSAGMLPFIILAVTWAGFDWLMSLTPFWQSTIFGAYYGAGGFLAAIAIVTIACLATRSDRSMFGYWMTKHHQHNLGKLLLAFVSFWAYIGFSQLLLVWIGNLPEEVPYYWIRLKTGWLPMSTFLIFGHFALPFVLLVPRTVKLMPRLLMAIAIWVLFVCMVDVYWMVLPALHEDGPHYSLYNFTAFLGVGGIAAAFAIFRLRGRYLVPVKDPYLVDSLQYLQPH
ncbi:MAG: hypothetical protein IRZ16_01470 [Myxococcaceae bacterium]|nr:hypothetical protein [Myxococcaceae bacterium]